jgi:hypothetical protein
MNRIRGEPTGQVLMSVDKQQFARRFEHGQFRRMLSTINRLWASRPRSKCSLQLIVLHGSEVQLGEVRLKLVSFGDGTVPVTPAIMASRRQRRAANHRIDCGGTKSLCICRIGAYPVDLGLWLRLSYVSREELAPNAGAIAYRRCQLLPRSSRRLHQV